MKRPEYFSPFVILSIILSLAVVSFAMGKKEKVDTGIHGKVQIWEGNFMPMIDSKSTSNKVKPGIDRKVRIYAAIQHDSETARSIMSGENAPAPLLEVVCDKKGEFTAPLSAGKYSVYVEEGAGWYANSIDSDGVQGAVTVEAGKLTETVIKVTKKATF